METALYMSRAPGAQPEAQPAPEIAEIASLVERTLGGDATAFEQIMLRYERRVLTVAMRLLGTADDAQDASQEVFLRAFRYMHRLDVRKPIEPWLVQITVNVCRNIGRTRQRPSTNIPEPIGASNPHLELAEEQERQLLWKALKELPEKERTAVILRDIDGLSTSEVATILCSSETTVRSQISRARVRLKEVIEKMTGAHL